MPCLKRIETITISFKGRELISIAIKTCLKRKGFKGVKKLRYSVFSKIGEILKTAFDFRK